MHYKNIILLAFFAVVIPICAIDNVHFYRASFFWGEPRLERDWLTTADFYLGVSSTKTARNNHGKKTSLLNIFGPHNMHKLGNNVPNLNPANELDNILINLNNVPNRNGFGQLQFLGKFNIIESVLNVYQNIKNGFFIQAYMPVRKLKISEPEFIDLSPRDNGYPNITTPEWQAFLTNFNNILERYHLKKSAIHKAGLGDLSILTGWTTNYEETKHLDYIDITGKIGVLIPTSATTNPDSAFDIPLGYNGHWGIPLKFDMSCGLFDWLTLGMHIGALFLIDTEKHIRMRTAQDQNGFIVLSKGEASVDPGSYLDTAFYAKADHFYKGFSLLVGYAYDRKEPDCITPKDPDTFDTLVVNNDQRFRSFRMHLLHLMLEYDFAKSLQKPGMHIGVFYNRIIGGKRIFNASMTVPYIGVNAAWCF